MSEIKTRAEAKEASIEKWFDILTRIGKIINDIDKMCGFCDLALHKANESLMLKCYSCEPDAKKLCEKYITDSGQLMKPLLEACQKTNTLLNEIRSLPVDLK